MKKYKIDQKGRVRLSSKLISQFNDKSSFGYNFNLENSSFVLEQNNKSPHYH
jgi:hypothetical protein